MFHKYALPCNSVHRECTKKKKKKGTGNQAQSDWYTIGPGALEKKTDAHKVTYTCPQSNMLSQENKCRSRKQKQAQKTEHKSRTQNIVNENKTQVPKQNTGPKSKTQIQKSHLDPKGRMYAWEVNAGLRKLIHKLESNAGAETPL